MVMSTFQKVTLATCVVLCVALLLPRMLLSRGRKDASGTEGGHFPPMVHRHMAPEARSQRAGSTPSSRAHKTEAVVARAKGAGAGAGLGTAAKSNLAGQIIPVYGFGILLYILYILFKITSKGNSQPPIGRFSSLRSENTKRKITDFELLQLQEKLRETEIAMENIVSKAHHSPDRDNKEVNVDQENLLQQLTEITRVMQEGQLVEGVARPNTRQRPWEEDEEAYPHDLWERPRCCCQHSPRREDDQDNHSENVSPDTQKADDAVGKDGTDTERQEDDQSEKKQRQGEGEEEQQKIELGVPEEELPGVLKELELTLKMTSNLEQETVNRLEMQAFNGGGVQVRRRNRRRSKKESQ
ncbi:protein RIC-3b [Corythoichthys intestinalis]|uniref:protein RIC-3b n=1 Tax=Corythoichthys intestinalis TaxID=161448 RepID=UPI0025A4CE4B|nr:protein RIC-3b [Corythoichthys intestinalis]XP_061812843.1 protein RIC-3-like [Nerophis lumbriciformis]